jgi:chromosome segregation ATPase
MSPNKNDGTPLNVTGDEVGIQLKKKIQRLSNKIMKLEAEVTKLKEVHERHTEDSIEMATIIRRLREERKHLKILLRTAEAELAKLKGEDPALFDTEVEHKKKKRKKRRNGRKPNSNSS